RGETLQRPTATEGPPGFEVRILESPLRQLIARPLVGALHAWRSGETWSNDVAQVTQRLHNLRAIHAFVFDALDRVVRVWGGRCSLLGRQRYRRSNKDQE